MQKENLSEEPTVQYSKPLDFEQVWQMFQETKKQFQETDKMLTEKFRKTDREIDKLAALFTTQWGKLVESLVEGDLIKLLKRRRIQVESTIQRRKGCREGQNYEFDIIAVNGNEIVIVEVKTTLRPQDVSYFLEKLEKAKIFMPEYNNRIIYGAVAFISADSNCERMAENSGLFVVKATGSSSSIINKSDFKPRVF
jgi:hypothetical protein